MIRTLVNSAVVGGRLFLQETKTAGIGSAIRKSRAVVRGLLTGRNRYHYRCEIDRAEAAQEIETFAFRPLISVVMPVFNTPPRLLKQAIESVIAQYYPYWELRIVDDASTRVDTGAVLDSLDDSRIFVDRLPANRGISGATNAALDDARGEYVAFFDHDDLLTPDALYECVRALNESRCEVLYSDEDFITESGRCVTPHFKPDFSPDLLQSHNYITHLLVANRKLIGELGGLRPEYDGAQDYDLLLRLSERTNSICHIRKVLYHWRITSSSTSQSADAKPYTIEAGRKALESTLQRRKIAGEVTCAPRPNFYRVRRKLCATPLVSVIVPFRDRPELLRRCVTSAFAHTRRTELELLLVDNGSVETATSELLDQLANSDSRIRVLRFEEEFNFSRINNWAVQHAAGEQLVLMNNDIAVFGPEWIDPLLEHSQRVEVGAVGAKLYYENGRIQHAGVILGVGGSAGHSHRHEPGNAPGYFNRLSLIQNVSAVTAALLMVKRSLYLRIGGLDEQHFKIAFNDVDFCLRLREIGLLNVFTPFCEAVHSESVSRGYEVSDAQRARFEAEKRALRERHPRIFVDGDPYYNRNLSLKSEGFSLRCVNDPAHGAVYGFSGAAVNA